MREIVNGIFYVMRAGCPWRRPPNDLPSWRTIYRWFATWRDGGRFERINHALVMADRERVGRDASPSAAIIDSRSVKTAEAGGPLGNDTGKRVNRRKRRGLDDTDERGLILANLSKFPVQGVPDTFSISISLRSRQRCRSPMLREPASAATPSMINLRTGSVSRVVPRSSIWL